MAKQNVHTQVVRISLQGAAKDGHGVVHGRWNPKAAEMTPGAVFVPTACYWDLRLEELTRLYHEHERDCKKRNVPHDPKQPLATPELSAEYLVRGGHWHCHYNGSGPTYSKIGHALAQALLDSLATKKSGSF